MPERSIGFVCLGPWDSTYCLRAKWLGSELEKRGWRVWYFIQPRDLGDSKHSTGGSHVLLPANTLRQAFTIRRFVKQNRVQWLHFLNPHFRALAITRMCKARVIGDWEDWCFIGHRGIKRSTLEWTSKKMLREVDLPVACSQSLRQEFARLGRPEAVFLPYAVVPQSMPKIATLPTEPIAVSMGNFYRSWDHDILLDAALLLAQQGKFPKIVMIGKGDDLARSQEFCRQRQLDNVQFTGFLPQTEMLTYLRTSHVLLFPIRDKLLNRYRCPFKVIQYAQAQRPILTCRVGEVPFFLGERACYADATPASFAEHLMRFMEQARQADIDYGIENHTWQARAEELERHLLVAESSP